MKQKIYILGVIMILVVFAGLIFKINHWPAAGILITMGITIFLLIFLPLALKDHYKAEGNRQKLSLYIVTFITCFIVFTSMLFKIMHWPYAGTLLLIAIPLPYLLFLPVFLTVTSRIMNFNIYNTVFILMLLVVNSVFSALLALNVAKNTIDDSYNISRNYNNIEAALENIPEGVQSSVINLKIDEILHIVDEYQNIILTSEGLTQDEWEHNPGGLLRPETRGRAYHALIQAGEDTGGTKLYKGLKSLIGEMANTSAYKELADAAPVIFNLIEPSGRDENWQSWIFAENTLSWILIYLDGLETNLKIIRATVK